MDPPDSNKRLKSSSGAPIRTTNAASSSGAANLPASQPPRPIIGGSGPGAPRSSVSIARPANGKTSLRLTVKAPPSKLRQATSGSSNPPNPYADTPSESDATPAPPTRPSRTTRNPRTVVDPDSDEDMEDDLDEEDAEGDVDQELLANEDSEEEDVEGEEDDEDELADHPPPPVITQQRAPGKSMPNVTVTAPPEGPLKSVEDKEMEDDDDDDELSELDSEQDAEGEEVEDDDEGGELEDSDEDEENSRSATPDLTKLTNRQRGAYVSGGELMSLSNEAQKKKHLTAEEHAMRRAEMARRRKNLSEKRNEEEKMDTINKLLSKPAPKRRTRAEMEAARAAEQTPNPDDDDPNRPDPTVLRWVSRKEGSLIYVSQEWQDSPIGEVFRKPGGGGGSMLVEEVS